MNSSVWGFVLFESRSEIQSSGNREKEEQEGEEREEEIQEEKETPAILLRIPLPSHSGGSFYKKDGTLDRAISPIGGDGRDGQVGQMSAEKNNRE